jgi:hypothetical protein
MDWHRQFGLMVTDFFTNSPFVVELEKDLSIRKQLLDVVILRKQKGELTERLPDGMDDLADHNLITFKSHRESLDDWALKELTGHYVNYRKQLSIGDEPLLPESAFRLYAVCSRFPHNLAQVVPWEEMQKGVYECRRGTDRIRVVVARQLPQSKQNAWLFYFTDLPELLAFARAHYRQHSPNTSSLIDHLLKQYQEEGIAMPYTMEDFQRDYAREHLKDLTPEERLEGLTPDQRLEGLTPEQLEQLRRKLSANRASPSPKKRRRK